MVRKSKLWVYILVSIIAIAIVIAIIFGIYLTKNISYAFWKLYDKQILKSFTPTFLSTKTKLLTINNVVYLPKTSYNVYYYPFHFQTDHGIIRYYINEILLIGHVRCQNNYAHFLADKLVPLMMVPKELIKRCYTIGNSKFPVVQEGLIAIGFEEYQIIDSPTPYEDWFYANKLHVFTEGRPMNAFGGPPCEMLRKQLSDFFKLDLINSTQYGMIDRHSKSRNIKNFEELYNLTKINFPDYNWVLIPDYIGDFNSTARIWATLRFSFAMTGSTCSKGIFMKPYTVLCIPTCDEIDFTIMNLLVGSNHAVRIFPTGFKHYAHGSFPINLQESIQAIKECLYYDVNKKWSSTA